MTACFLKGQKSTFSLQLLQELDDRLLAGKDELAAVIKLEVFGPSCAGAASYRVMCTPSLHGVSVLRSSALLASIRNQSTIRMHSVGALIVVSKAFGGAQCGTEPAILSIEAQGEQEQDWQPAAAGLTEAASPHVKQRDVQPLLGQQVRAIRARQTPPNNRHLGACCGHPPSASVLRPEEYGGDGRATGRGCAAA